MVLKGVNWVHIDKIRSNGLERNQLGTQYKKTGNILLRGVNLVHNDKIRSGDLERSQLDTQSKSHVIWS